jgi:hypothetical protein
MAFLARSNLVGPVPLPDGVESIDPEMSRTIITLEHGVAAAVDAESKQAKAR